MKTKRPTHILCSETCFLRSMLRWVYRMHPSSSMLILPHHTWEHTCASLKPRTPVASSTTTCRLGMEGPKPPQIVFLFQLISAFSPVRAFWASGSRHHFAHWACRARWRWSRDQNGILLPVMLRACLATAEGGPGWGKRLQWRPQIPTVGLGRIRGWAPQDSY
jgi:hypothetical protein